MAETNEATVEVEDAQVEVEEDESDSGVAQVEAEENDNEGKSEIAEIEVEEKDEGEDKIVKDKDDEGGDEDKVEKVPEVEENGGEGTLEVAVRHLALCASCNLPVGMCACHEAAMLATRWMYQHHQNKEDLKTQLLRSPSSTVAAYRCLQTSWSPNLPPPSVALPLCAFFARHHPTARIWIGPSADSFLRRLVSPSDSPTFPHVGLIHAICAVAMPYAADRISLSGEVVLSEPGMLSQYWAGYGTPARYHIASSLSATEQSLEEGQHILDLMAIYFLLASAAFLRCRFVQSWHIHSRMARLALLHQKVVNTTSEARTHSSSLSRRAHDGEKEQRARYVSATFRTMFWFVFLLDNNWALASGFDPILSEDRIHTMLPGPSDKYDEFLDVKSPRFFSAPRKTDWRLEAILIVKAAILSNRILYTLKHVPRLPNHTLDHFSFQAFVRGPLFRAVLQDLNDFRTCFRNAYEQQPPIIIERQQLALHTGYHLHIAMLYEPFIAARDGDPAARRCSQAISMAVERLVIGLQTDFTFAGAQLFTVFAKRLCGVMIKIYAIRRSLGDVSGAQLMRQLIDHVLFALRSDTWPIYSHYASEIVSDLAQAHESGTHTVRGEMISLIPPAEYSSIDLGDQKEDIFAPIVKAGER